MAQNIIGPLTIEGSLGITGGSLELGNNLPEGETPYIDFHLGTGSAEDFNVRLINSQNRRLDFITQLDGTILSLNAGNVGIGTTSPTTKLDVNGKVKAATLEISNKLTVLDNGNIGIGTISPTTKLEVNGTVKATAFVGNGAGLSGIASSQWTTRGLNIHFTSGNVGIGTQIPSAKLHLTGGTDAELSGGGFLVIGQLTGGNIVFDDNEIIARNNGQKSILHLQANGGDLWIHSKQSGATNFIIKDNGNVGIGGTNPVHPLHMGGGAFCDDGKIWRDASSIEYKKDVTPLALSQALETLAGLNPVTFRFKETTADEKHVGFIAEEVPALVVSKDRKGLSAMDIVSVLTKVVQHQQQEIESLKAERRDSA